MPQKLVSMTLSQIMTHLIKNFNNFPSAIPYIIPNTKIPTIDISVIAEQTLFFLFWFLLAKPAIANTTDRNNKINAMKIIKLQTIASHKPITKNVSMRHNKLKNPKFVLFNPFVSIILIFYNTYCIKEWHSQKLFLQKNKFFYSEHKIFIHQKKILHQSFQFLTNIFAFFF